MNDKNVNFRFTQVDEYTTVLTKTRVLNEDPQVEGRNILRNEHFCIVVSESNLKVSTSSNTLWVNKCGMVNSFVTHTTPDLKNFIDNITFFTLKHRNHPDVHAFYNHMTNLLVDLNLHHVYGRSV